MLSADIERSIGLKWLNPQNGQTHTTNSSAAVAEELFECV